MPIKKTLRFLLLTCFWFQCIAQNSTAFFHEIHLDGGRFNKKTNTIFEDHLGYLWLGTDSGLYRYDGHTVVENQYDVFDENSIPNNSINSIIEDDFGNLWIGSESYLIWYNRKTNHFKGFYKNNTSTVLGKSKDGTIWANLRRTGIVKIVPKENISDVKFQTQLNYHQDNKVWTSDRTLNDFTEDLFGRKWFASPKGIMALNEKNKLVDTGFYKNTSFLVSGVNNTFLATTDEGVFLLEYHKSEFKLKVIQKLEGFIDGQNKQEFTSIVANEESGTLWLSSPLALYKVMPTKSSYVINLINDGEGINGNLYENRINASLIDKYNNLWVATNKGVKKYIDRNSIFEYTSLGDDFSNLFSQSLCKGKDNELLVTLNNKGLYSFDLKSKSIALLATTPEEHTVIKKDFTNKELLYGSGKSLLLSKDYNSKIKNVRFDTLKTFQYNIKDVVALPHEIWVGLWGGGIQIITEDNDLNNFKKEVITSLSGKNISVMLLDANRNLWIGTRGDGLFKVNLINEEIKVFNPTENGLSSNAILCLFEDFSSNLWIGTRGGGLHFYNTKDKTIKGYGKNEGLMSTTVVSIGRLRGNNLWLSTRDGISRFDMLEGKFVNFEVEDGVTESHFMFNSYTEDENGLMYFGCPGGFFTVNADNYKKALNVPNTVITKYTVFDDFKEQLTENENAKKYQFSKGNLELSHDENNIAFEFSSLDFTAPNKNQFAYKLEGVNDFWHYTKASNRNANYNDLPTGDYIFKVKSTNSDGLWNENPATLKFTINPPFWRSNLAYVIYFILIITSIYTSWLLVKRWYRLKNNLIKETIIHEKDNEHNRMKMIFFTDISHELRTPLTLILGTIEKIVKEKNFTLTPKTSQRIYNNSLRIKRLINQIMDIRKFDVGEFKLSISKNDIVKDIRTIKNAFNDFAKVYEIKYEFVSKEKEIIGWYDVDILEKILFNLLSNAFKYTEKNGEIKVTIELTRLSGSDDFVNLEKGDYIKCSVHDNGLGIPKENLKFIFNRYYQTTKSSSNQVPGTGIGMELVQKLIERHHGKVLVESEESIFTEFTFYLPLEKTRYNKNERTETGSPLKRNYIKNSEYQIIEEVGSEHDAKTNSKVKSKPKVLIVEDNTELRSMVKEELMNDFNVIEACNGKEGYERITNENPDLIISDILMPVEDGISMLKRIKENTEINNIPIFMLTAKNSNDTKIECLSLGADDYIEKPFSLEFVKWKIKNVFNTRKQLKDKYSKVITVAPSEISMVSNNEKFIKKLITIVENSMNDNLLSVEYLASEVGMSRANLYRKLQAILNDTPVNFIKKIKLKRAEQLLKNNDMYISEIAYMTGFNDQKYFGKCFQKEYGMSPTEYIMKYASKDKMDTVDLNLYQ